MVKKKIISLLLVVALLGLLSVQVFGAETTSIALDHILFKSITLTQNCSQTEKTTKQISLQDNAVYNAKEYVITVTDAADIVSFVCNLETLSSDSGQVYKFYKAASSVSTDGTVSLNVKKTHTDTTKPLVNNEVVSSDFPSTGEIPLENPQVEVSLKDGSGETDYLALYLGTITGVDPSSGTPVVTRNYELQCIFKFKFVTGTQEIDPTPIITKDLSYSGHLCEPNGTLEPLSVTASAAEGVTLTYQWYKGASNNAVTEAISNATTSSYAPPTDSIGTTYYKVVVTGTSGARSESVTSTVARVVVRERVERSFELNRAFNQNIEKLEGSDSVYYLKWQTADMMDSSPIALGSVLLTGVLPDGVTIQKVWSGSPADQFDLEKAGALTVDEETGTFRLLAQTYETGFEGTSAISHTLGKCYYIQLSDGNIYTLVVDNDYRQHEVSRRPQVVTLVDEDSTATIPGTFWVSNLQSYNTTSSVIRGTVTSATPIVLRAQIQSGGDDLSTQRVNTNRSGYYWNKAQSNWVVVNGERLPANGFFAGNAKDEQDYSSPAFTLKPGLNVVEVYTDAFSFYLDPSVTSATTGLGDRYIDRTGNESSTPVFSTNSVVYLINYIGESATEIPSEKTDTDLASIAALRFGDEDSQLESCPFVWNEETSKYTLALPIRYKTDANSTQHYSHAVLLSLRPKAAGASAEIVSNASGLIVGKQVGSCVFLNMEALKGQDDPGFTIRVTSADGSKTTEYPVSVIYASSATSPEVSVSNVKLDIPFNANTYAYYLDYTSASAQNGTMVITLPAGSTATINGTNYTNGEKFELDPKKDFYCLTIKAEDQYTITKYYFVTRYENGTIPFSTVSDDTKALAKELLGKWYTDLTAPGYTFGSYWNVFMAKATTGTSDQPAFDFDKKSVMHPAKHTMTQATDWAACIMEIIMLGRNPYDFPRYENGVLNEHYNYVQGLIDCGTGPFANDVWYTFAAQAAGLKHPASTENALNRTFDLDTRAWTIAALSGELSTKELAYYVDSLHDVQDTSGTYTSLWTNQSYHGASSGNAYTIGCVLSAIASAGADPDVQFAYGNHTPLQTIKETMYKDGLFYSNGSNDGVLPKDMIIGLGDVLHGSNVWARYTLTADKYDSLITEAKTLNVDTSSMPATFTQTTACGRAYYDLYDDVYDALVAAGRTTEAKEMRPDVIWGMPYEVFADAVKAMPEASALTVNDLAKLEELIKQYEAMDAASRKAVASDVLAKYQALVAKGLSLKAGDNRAANLYKDILALPDAANIGDSNKKQVKASVDAIRDAMSKADEDLLKWAGASVLGKLEAVEQELEDPTEKITVTFTLLGDHKHTETETNVKHTLTAGNLETWIAESTYQVNPDTTVWDFMQPILEKNGIKWDAGTGDSVYVKSLTYKGKTIGEFTNGKLSGWQYTVNGEYPDVSVAAKKLSAGDEIIFHYTDDYTVDDIKGGDKPDPTPSGDKYTDQQISDAYRATGNALALKNPTTGSVGGEWLMLGLARADHVISSSSKDAYLSSVRSYINENYNNGKLSKDKSTENSRIILALTALGEDPQTFVTGKNLLEGYSDFDWTVQQGVTGPIFALLAIDSQKYTVPDYATIRNDLIEEILKAQENNGGWSADGKTVDVDMTAMAIQALAPYYKTNTAVKEAVDTALVYLVSQQNEATGAFPNAKSELSAESTAQVIVALTSLGKNPATEKRFQAGDKKLSPIDGLMRFYKGNGKFSHKLDADANDMATEQSYYALVSYYRLKNGKTSLYDMTDLKDNTPESVASVIAKIDAIGSVTEDSYEDIIAAREAYKKLSSAEQDQLPDGYLEILKNAEKEYAELLANKKTDAKKELNDYYLGIDQKDYGEAGRKKLSEILAKAQRDITSAKSCPQVDSILRQAISDLDAVRKGDITVSFRLIGSLEATQDVNLTTDSYLPEYVTWIPTTKYELASNATVYDLFTEALRDAGLSAIGAEGGYVKTIYAPSCLGGYTLSEFTNGKRSGWMYTLNGKHSSNALTDQKLEDGDMVVWHYVNDYSHEVSDWSGDSQHPSLGNGTYYNGWLRAADISPERYVEQLLGKILTVGKNGTVEPKLTLSHLGKSVTFTFKPDKGHRVKDVKVDGKSVGPVASYTVDKLSVSTRIEVTFTNGKLPFTDVRESDWFYDDVVFAYENGLFAGTSDTTFSPNASMTRAMLVTVLYRLEGQPTVNGRSGFSDVTFNSYYEDAVTWAADNGIVNGISTSTFSPNANVTREQMAAILYRYAQYKKYNTAASSSLNSFSDHASVSGYAVMPLQWAVAEKLINGSAGKLMPTGNATRAQVAAILHRFVTNVAK